MHKLPTFPKFYCRFLQCFCCLLFLFLSNGLWAQETKWEGPKIVTVFEKDLLSPLAGVAIVNADTTFVTSTDSKGKANLSNLKLEDSLTFEMFGYQTRTVTIKDIKEKQWKLVLSLESNYSLNEVLVLGHTRTPERAGATPSIVDVIETKQIELYNPGTSAEMLEKTGRVFVQKSQMGGGSPILRGFEANKILIVLDGVRLNNAIYRSGHLQNIISIDNSMLERTEVIYGPASVMYGSDALGGVMHFYTKKPRLKSEEDKPYNLNALMRFGTANLERTGHVDFNYGQNKWASMTSFSISAFNNLRAGNNRPKNYPDFGKQYFYQERFGLSDSVMVNPDPNLQIGTAYSQVDALQKIRFQPNEHVEFNANMQFSTSTKVPRFDQLSQGDLIYDDSTGALLSKDFKFAEWDYGPQTRLMGVISTDIRKENPLFSQLKLIAAYQNINEERITRKFNDQFRRTQQEKVQVASFNGDIIKEVGSRFKVFYGGELSQNWVRSNAFRKSLVTNEVDDRVQTRYPDGGSTMLSAGVYASLQAKIGKRDHVNLRSGIRYNFIGLNSIFIDTSFFQLSDVDITLNTKALTGSLGAAWDIGKGFNFRTALATAFRAPNLDDFGKIRSKNGYVTIPNPNLVSEKSLNAEVSLSKDFGKRFRIGGNYYYTYLFDAIVRETCAYDPNDPESISDCVLIYDGAFDTIQYNANAAEAFIYGVSGRMTFNILENLKLESSLDFTYGQNISRDGPFGHIPPIYGQTSLTYQYKKAVTVKFLANYNGWKRLKRYSQVDSSENLDLATPEGSPGWYTLNLYSSFKISKIHLSLAFENILDQHYRSFSSGVSAPGRNIIVGLRVHF